MPASSRRDFLKSSALTTTAVALGSLPAVHAAGSDLIRVGLIGCGGRGSGAAGNVLESSPNVKLVAMGDVFEDRLKDSLKGLKKHGDKVDVTPDRAFVGLDAFEKVLSADINYVILATPPAFRPQHLKAAVAAGKNIFTEKPVAVDGAGIRTVLEVAEQARAKGLGVGAGTQRRHQTSYLEIMKRVHGGAIGDIVAARCYWNQGGLWMKERKTEWSDLEWQIRNWLYFTWLSGDHMVEQHVHNLDVVRWAIRGNPIRAVGMGGRQVRTEPSYGHIFDHFAVDYEFPGGVHVMSMCRQIDGCENNVAEGLAGTKGMCRTSDKNYFAINGPTGEWSFNPKEDNSPYVQEHTDLIASIRAGSPINELKNVAESTLMAIMGRMSTYSGKAVTWDQALNSKDELVPAKLAWGPMTVPPVAMPGQTKLG